MGVIPGVVDISKKTVPNAPTVSAVDVGLNRTYDDGSVTVSFTDPVYTGRLPITAYNASTVSGSPSGTNSGGTSPRTITGLNTTNGGSYTFNGTVTNAVGNSANSTTTGTVTVTSVPALPPVLTATRVDNGTVNISWTGAHDNGGKTITGYSITSSIAVSYDTSDVTSPIAVTGNFQTTTAAAPTSVSATRIDNSTVDINFTAPSAPTAVNYTFNTAGINANGTGATRNPNVAPNTSGIASYTIEGRRADTLASISLTRDNAADLTSPIRVTGSFLGSVPGTPVIQTPLVVGQDAVDVYFSPPSGGGVGYQFRIRANSSTNNGTFSGYTTAIIPNTGTITGYSIQSNPSIALTYSSSDTTSPIGVTGSFNTNTTYTFRVAAINATGTGSYSSYSTSVTPDPRKLCTSAQITVGCCTATTTCGFYGAGTNCTTVTGTFEAGAC